MVEQPKGEELSAAAVKRIVTTVRDTNLHTFSSEDITRYVYMLSRNQATFSRVGSFLDCQEIMNPGFCSRGRGLE